MKYLLLILLTSAIFSAKAQIADEVINASLALPAVEKIIGYGTYADLWDDNTYNRIATDTVVKMRSACCLKKTISVKNGKKIITLSYKWEDWTWETAWWCKGEFRSDVSSELLTFKRVRYELWAGNKLIKTTK